MYGVETEEERLTMIVEINANGKLYKIEKPTELYPYWRLAEQEPYRALVEIHKCIPDAQLEVETIARRYTRNNS